MSTVNDKGSIAKLLESDGWYPDDPQCYAIYSYYNDYGIEVAKVFYPHKYTKEYLIEFFESPHCHSIQRLWDQEDGLTPEGKEWIRKYKT